MSFSLARLVRSPFTLLAAALILRSAGLWFGILNIDESDFSLIGRGILDGALPYVDIVDNKPPLTYFFFTAAGAFGGVSIIPVHLLGVVWVVLTSLVLRRAALLWTGNQDMGWAAAWLALLGTLCEVPSVNSEILMNLPSALALFYFVRAEQGRLRDDFLCGALIGIASLFKHQAALLIGALGLALAIRMFRRPQPATALRGLALLVGMGIPWGIAVAAYARAGHLAEFFDWVVLNNLALAGGAGGGSAPLLFLRATALSVGSSLILWILAVKETLRPSALSRGPTRTALLLALWMTWIPVCAGGRFYGHYYLQFVPLLALLAAPGAVELLNRWRDFSYFRRAALAAACLVPAAASVCVTLGLGLTGRFPGQDRRVVELSRWLESNTRPDESLFVWGHYSPIYYLSRRSPGTRYVTCSVHLGNYDPELLPPNLDLSQSLSERDVVATLSDLERNRVPLFVDTSPAAIHGWDRLPISNVPALASYFAAHYRLVAQPGGALVYRRE